MSSYITLHVNNFVLQTVAEAAVLRGAADDGGVDPVGALAARVLRAVVRGQLCGARAARAVRPQRARAAGHAQWTGR